MVSASFGARRPCGRERQGKRRRRGRRGGPGEVWRVCRGPLGLCSIAETVSAASLAGVDGAKDRGRAGETVAARAGEETGDREGESSPSRVSLLNRSRRVQHSRTQRESTPAQTTNPCCVRKQCGPLRSLAVRAVLPPGAAPDAQGAREKPCPPPSPTERALFFRFFCAPDAGRGSCLSDVQGHRCSLLKAAPSKQASLADAPTLLF